MILQAILALVLINELYKVTLGYFSFDRIITIEMRNNFADDNFPVITLSIDVNNQDIENEVHKNSTKVLNCPRDNYEILEENNKFQQTYEWLSCWGFTEKYLLDTNVIPWIFNGSGLNFSVRYSNLTKNIIMGWNVRELDQMYSGQTYIFLSFKLDEIILKQNSNNHDGFLQISHLKRKYGETKRIKNILLHSQTVPNFDELLSVDHLITSDNYSLLLSKTLTQYMEPPFGECSDYKPITQQHFNASSYMQCKRQCLRHFGEMLYNCTPLLIDGSFSELDFPTNDKTLCDLEKIKAFEAKPKYPLIVRKCKKFCPIDCKTVDYSYSVHKTDSRIGNENWYNLSESERYYRKSLNWDSTQPMFAYNEESVMSFTDYLVNCGGLIGLWFGTNANDLIIWLIEWSLWTNIWNKVQQYLGMRTVVNRISIIQ